MLKKVSDSIQVLHWRENITLENVELFRHSVKELLDLRGKYLILNLANTSYINSAGLGIIAEGVMDSRKNNKELVIAEINTSVQEIFSIVKFASFMKVFDSEQEAVEYFLVNKDEKDKQ